MSALFNPRTAFIDYTRQEGKMDAIIGRYRVLTQENSLTLTHPTGMSFVFTLTEALELIEFIRAHRSAIAEALDATKSEGEAHIADEKGIPDKDRI